ncbi:ABC transporter ATP-binding protein [Anaerococcus sp. Marseille-P9784]|uniref:ABC transporter ATP-binding protein n=1 Tax=Anaerococcus sp. Marseille-P9784 TaxID=2614127 RepID=UPI00124A07E3|nr:oligopeptide/dipeptide ABC transporter ATP-binding protein [Anaerococcus sp. Marseille-P9784]
MEKLYQVKNLKKYYPIKKSLFGANKYLKAVDDVSFDIYKGETFGLVGESGSGKSTIGKCLTKIEEISDGEILYKDKSIIKSDDKTIKYFRNNIQAIFQDPYSSLNPTLNIFEIIAEPIRNQEKLTESQIKEKVASLMEKVGISADYMEKKPREFSGGQRQRISIARAISTNPEFILCDEPISALDVSIQAQIVNLLEDIQKDLGITYLFIAHDLAMVEHISDRIGVLYMGHLVEIGDSRQIYENPKHPYTIGLLNSILDPRPRRDKTKPLKTISSDIPSPIDLPKGCVFQTRCPYKTDGCLTESPQLEEFENGHKIACFNAEKISSY